MANCIVCKEGVDKLIAGVPVHSKCLKGKSPQIVAVEAKYDHSIEEILIACIKRLNTWEERYTELGVSKVTIYCWCKKFLNMTPLQAVATYKPQSKSTQSASLQTGSRDYLRHNQTMFIPE